MKFSDNLSECFVMGGGGGGCQVMFPRAGNGKEREKNTTFKILISRSSINTHIKGGCLSLAADEVVVVYRTPVMKHHRNELISFTLQKYHIDRTLELQYESLATKLHRISGISGLFQELLP